MSLLTLKVSEVENLMNKGQKTEVRRQKPDYNAENLSSVLCSLTSVCVKCGSCKALCPTYTEDATEGMSARGRIVLLKKFYEGYLDPSSKLNDKIFSCMLCGACNKLCPLGINVTEVICEGRKNFKEFSKKRRLFSFGVRFGLKRASNSFRILKFLETVNELIPVYKLYPFNVIKRMDIQFPDSALREGISIYKASKPRGRIALFTGCSVNFIYPNIGRSLIESLNTMNYDVILPKGEVCCGAPLMGLGLREDAAEMAERNMNAFKKLNIEAVIGICPTCIDFIKNEYRNLIGDGINNAVEVSQFFMDKIQKIKDRRQKADNKSLASDICYPGSVIYHDPCHCIYGLDVSAEPRQILKSMGFHLMDSERGCCGFGGTFRLLYQELSERILEKKVEEYKRADMIVTSCPNCILQLRSRIKDRPVKHIAEVINEIIKGDKRYGKKQTRNLDTAGA